MSAYQVLSGPPIGLIYFYKREGCPYLVYLVGLDFRRDLSGNNKQDTEKIKFHISLGTCADINPPILHTHDIYASNAKHFFSPYGPWASHSNHMVNGDGRRVFVCIPFWHQAKAFYFIFYDQYIAKY